MTIRTADVRLLGPSAQRVLLLDAPTGYDAALRSAGVDVVAERPELVIAGAGLADRAAASDAPAVIVLGHASRVLRRAGYETRTVVRRGAGPPRLLVPLDARAALGSSLLSARPGRSAPKRIAIGAALLSRRAGLPGVPVITVGQRSTAQPAMLAEAGRVAGVELGADWFLWLGEGDDLQRAVWVCFGPGPEPVWAVKCSRVSGNAAPFAREEQAWHVLASLPAELRRPAPRHAGRFEVGGLEGSIESAAPGVPLQDELEAGVPRRMTVEAVADWIVAVGQATVQPSDALEPELRRLEHDVGAPADLVRSLPSVPAVLQHNDLGSWNVLVDGSTFAVLDWESSRMAGVPLWDLVYFLTDALSARRGQIDPVEKRHAMLSLLRGDSPDSDLLFRRLAEAAAAFGIPRDAIGPIVTLAWLHHGRSRSARVDRGQSQGASTGRVSTAGPLERIAETWLADPALGVAWRAFRG